VCSLLVRVSTLPLSAEVDRTLTPERDENFRVYRGVRALSRQRQSRQLPGSTLLAPGLVRLNITLPPHNGYTFPARISLVVPVDERADTVLAAREPETQTWWRALRHAVRYCIAKPSSCIISS
jgi:hypothetical protein